MEANITWLTDQLATGGDLSLNADKAERQFAELIEMDLSLVIDCRVEADDAELWDGTGVSYLHLPTMDAYGHHIPFDHFDRAVEEAMHVIEDGGKVFVHCHMGVNRGPSTAFAVLLALGYGPAAAFDLIRRKRKQAGIVYADDALRAHLRRKGASDKVTLLRMRTLKSHIAKVMTIKQRKAIQHIIRANHEQDYQDLLEAKVG